MTILIEKEKVIKYFLCFLAKVQMGIILLKTVFIVAKSKARNVSSFV
jgi:hypothetical protein